jgi:tetratricopeptide (TPR) repeat protein
MLWVLCLVGLGCAGPAKTGVDLKAKAIELNDSGYQYYRQSRFNLAQEKFSQALKYNRLIDRRAGIAANLNNLGVIAREQGELDQAVAYFKEALAVNQELGDAAALSETLNNLGVAYLAQGQKQAAADAFGQALDWARRLPPGPLLALSLSHQGDVAREWRDYDLALNYYHQALRVDEGGKDFRGRARREERLGRTFLDLKDYGRALFYLNGALKEFRRLQDTDGIADTLRDLTWVALAQGDEEALRLNGGLLLELYQSRGQEEQANQLIKLLKEKVSTKQ